MPALGALRAVRDWAFYIATLRHRTVRIQGLNFTLENASPRMRYVMFRGYESEDADLASQILAPDDSVLEAGSAIGFLALHCIKQIGVRNYCMVEANADLIPVIAKNFMLNGVQLPNLIEAAVSGEDGLVSFGINRNFWSSSTLMRKGERRRSVVGRSIPSILAELPFRPTALIMDIEGGEAKIPPEHFRSFEKIVIELHPKLTGVDAADTLRSTLHRAGFETVAQKGGSFAILKRRARSELPEDV